MWIHPTVQKQTVKKTLVEKQREGILEYYLGFCINVNMTEYEKAMQQVQPGIYCYTPLTYLKKYFKNT